MECTVRIENDVRDAGRGGGVAGGGDVGVEWSWCHFEDDVVRCRFQAAKMDVWRFECLTDTWVIVLQVGESDESAETRRSVKFCRRVASTQCFFWPQNIVSTQFLWTMQDDATMRNLTVTESISRLYPASVIVFGYACCDLPCQATVDCQATANLLQSTLSRITRIGNSNNEGR